MKLQHAAIQRSKFENEVAIPAMEEAIKDGRIPIHLVEPAMEAVRIAKAPGEVGQIGQAMLAQVAMVITLHNAQKPRKRVKK